MQTSNYQLPSKTDDVGTVCRDIDSLINHFFEDIPLVRKDLNHLEHLVTSTFTKAESASFTRIRNLIMSQENLCMNVRTFKNLAMEKFKMFDLDKDHSDRTQIEKVTQELAKQQTINKNMKREVMELNELITDHIQMSKKKIWERDNEIMSWKRKYEKLLESPGTYERVEEKQKDEIQIPQRNSLETIKQQEQINNSNIKTDEHREDNLQTHISSSSENNLNSEQNLNHDAKTTSINFDTIKIEAPTAEPRMPTILRTEQSSDRERKSNSKTKVKYFIDDFRRASGSLDLPNDFEDGQQQFSPTPKTLKKKNQNPENRKGKSSCVLNLYSGENYIHTLSHLPVNSSTIISDSSSINHLEVAENQKDGHWIPYKNTSPKKTDFSKSQAWKILNKKSANSSLNDITVNCSNISVSELSHNLNGKNSSARKQKIILTKKEEQTMTSSFMRANDSHQNNSGVSRPISKQKIAMAIKSHDIANMINSVSIGKRAEKRVTHFKHPIQLQYLDQLNLNVGTSTEELKYEGPRKQGLRNGKGKLQYSSGVFYEGQFKDNVRHGYGVLSVNGKVVFSGDWERDKICGNGTIKNLHLLHRPNIFADPGFSTFLRQAWYNGEFEENRFHGNGTLFINCQKIIGIFHDGRLEGEYSYCRKDGRVELGNYNEISRMKSVLS